MSSASLVPGGAGDAPLLDCVKAMATYIHKMLRPRDKERAREVAGVKVLLLDRETKTMLSMVVGMNEILSRDVFLVELLDAPHPNMKHMKAIVLVRPTEENVRLLRTALAAPGGPDFAEYHLFFTNVVPGDALRRLADADKTGAVHQVQVRFRIEDGSGVAGRRGWKGGGLPAPCSPAAAPRSRPAAARPLACLTLRLPPPHRRSTTPTTTPWRPTPFRSR